MCFFKRATERLKFHRKPLSFSETPAVYFTVFTSEPLNQPLLFCEPLSHVLKHGMDSRKALQATGVRAGGREGGRKGCHQELLTAVEKPQCCQARVPRTCSSHPSPPRAPSSTAKPCRDTQGRTCTFRGSPGIQRNLPPESCGI